MIELNSIQGWTIMLSLAALFGAIGGLAYEVLERIRTASHEQRSGLWWIANPFLGAVAANAILYSFPVTTTTVTQLEGGGSSTTYGYELVKLISLSLIVGSAGGSILTNLQARFMASLSEERTKTAVNLSDMQLRRVESLANSNEIAVSNAIGTSAPVIREQLESESTGIDEREEAILEQLSKAFALYQHILQEEAQTAKEARRKLIAWDLASRFPPSSQEEQAQLARQLLALDDEVSGQDEDLNQGGSPSSPRAKGLPNGKTKSSEVRKPEGHNS